MGTGRRIVVIIGCIDWENMTSPYTEMPNSIDRTAYGVEIESGLVPKFNYGEGLDMRSSRDMVGCRLGYASDKGVGYVYVYCRLYRLKGTHRLIHHAALEEEKIVRGQKP